MLSRVEISVYALYPDTCGRSYPYILVYAQLRLSFLCNAHALLTNPLRCPDTNRIRVDGRIRFVYATCGRRYFYIRIKKFADTKISGYVWTGPKPPAENSNICLSETAYQHKETRKKCKKTNQAAIIQ